MNIKPLFTFMILILFLAASCSDKTSTSPYTAGNSTENGDDTDDDPKIARGWTIPEYEV